MKNIFLLLFCLLSAVSYGQEQEKNTVQWGFSLGIETQTLGIEALDRKTGESAAVVSGPNKPGAVLSIIGRKKIWHGFAFESGMSLSYNHNRVEFTPGGSSIFQFTDLELPVYFSFTNQEKSVLPLRGKVLFGAHTSWNLAQNAGDRLQFLRERLGIDLGLGVEVNLGKAKLYPTVIYSHGINNLHDFTGTEFDYFVGRAVRDKLAFRVVVERNK